ncbi:SRP19 protein [Sarocladium implicatum]|jgi:signal recognition particle subunit SRP19|nr:SRP19 protein [Sarocladium implicatum]
MSHPRVEEVSDSDLDSDPEEMDLDDFAESDIMRRIPDPSSTQPAIIKPQQQQQPPSSSQQQGSRFMQPPPSQEQTLPATADRSQYNGYQCLYPVYFDASRSRAEGRRVGADLAVKDPLAREIANACSRLRIPTLLEPEKTHPKDWANPGRVKFDLKTAMKEGNKNVKNKHHLYILIAQHLKENPTTDKSPGLRVRMGGEIQPDPSKPYPKPAVPRGWKMGEYVPFLSPAMTGGGVSENLFKDMMSQMQGGGDPMAALMGGAAGGSAEASGTDDGGGGKKKKKGKGKA